MKKTLLIVDDEQEILDVLRNIFEDEGYRIFTLKQGSQTQDILSREKIDLVMLDIWMKDADGIEILQQIKHKYPKIPVIMISGHGDIETAVKTTKLGAYSFIEKPPDYDRMMQTVHSAVRESIVEYETTSISKKKSKIGYSPDIVGMHPLIETLKHQIEVIAPSEGRVLIYGENGTGKEVVARKIHALSKRKNEPFVEVNCAAIPESLIESELFGHEKGSFTGADRKKIGKFDQANNGTLFLDEIADMSPATQAKILRVLQEQRFERIGGHDNIQVDVRIIAASNKRLEDEIAAGNFRQDLFYRLNTLSVSVPSLRERLSDIPLLTECFIDLFCHTSQYTRKPVSDRVLTLFQKYSWPGNVRELKNVIERMLIISGGNELSEQDLPPSLLYEVKNNEMSMSDDRMNFTAPDYPETLKEAREEFERNYIIRMLEKNRGNISKTAEQIKVERSHLHKKIKQYDIKIS